MFLVKNMTELNLKLTLNEPLSGESDVMWESDMMLLVYITWYVAEGQLEADSEKYN